MENTNRLAAARTAYELAVLDHEAAVCAYWRAPGPALAAREAACQRARFEAHEALLSAKSAARRAGGAL